MTDTDKLKRLKKEIKRKEFWRETRDGRDYVVDEICEADDYGAEERHAYPEWLRGDILALIAENERLKDEESLKIAAYDRVSAEIEHSNRLAKERDDAVALLREWDRAGIDATGGGNLDDNTEAFLARIDTETQEK